MTRPLTRPDWTQLLLLLAMLSCGMASSRASPVDTLRSVRERLQRLEQQLFHTEAKRQDVAAALRDSEAAIARIEQALAQLAAQKKQADAELAEGRAHLDALQTRIQQTQQQLGQQLASQYKTGQADALVLLLNQQDLGRASRQLVYYQYLSRARNQRLQALRQDLVQAQQLTLAQQQKELALEQILRGQAAQKQRLEAEQQNRRLLLARLSAQAAGQQQQISQLKQDEHRLSRLVEQLAHAAGPLTHHVPPLPGKPGHRGFEQLKGQLQLPVAGHISNQFGSPRTETGAPWKGIFIQATAGKPVTAVAAGRVVYASWLRGFGHLLIIDHGRGYMTLYGNNQSIARHTGELVQAGDTIALVGNSGNNKEPGVYYELRYQGKPLDPLGWSAAGH